jgi:hypothetical protein
MFKQCLYVNMTFKLLGTRLFQDAIYIQFAESKS